MMEKIFIWIILIDIYFAMVYDEEINTSGTFTYLYKPKYTLRTYKLNKYKEYYEIYNMNITLNIYKGETQIIKLDNNLEYAYYFKYNTNEVYYITAMYPSTCELCGFIVSSEDHEINRLSDEYNTTLYFGRYRKFSFKIQNKEKTPQILKIIIRMNSNQYGIFNKAYFEENGIAFSPYNISDYTYSYKRSNTSFPIISDELIFKPEFMFQYNDQQKNYYEVGIELIYDNSSNIISKNSTECIPKNTFVIFKISNPSNKFFYEISFSNGSLIYLVKNNIEKIKLNSISKYNINDYSILYVNSSINYTSCFSIIFTDDKNTISSNTDFKLTLFDSRNYNVTIINKNKKYIQINYIKNDYFNVHLYQNQEIKYKFFKLNKYYFIFEKNSDEFSLQFKFEKNKELIENYYEIEFSYYGLDEDIDIEIINENTFKCLNKTSFYILKFNSDKPYIYFLSNDSSSVYLNDLPLNAYYYNFFKLEQDGNFDIYADYDNYINCFELKYEINYGSFDFESFSYKNFKLTSDNIFVFNLKNLIKNMNYKIIIFSYENNIHIDSYELDNKIYDYDEIIQFIPTKEISKLKLPITLIEKNIIDDVDIFFYYEQYIESDFSTCVDSVHYYVIKNSELYNNIYLLIDNKINSRLDDKAIIDLDNKNNFYELNKTDIYLDIYAKEDSIICFDLKFEKNYGFFEYEKEKNKTFFIVTDTNLTFNLVNLEKDVKYQIKIKSQNVQINYYYLENKKYNFENSIVFIAKSNEIKFELPVKLNIINDIENNKGKIDIYYNNLEIIIIKPRYEKFVKSVTFFAYVFLSIDVLIFIGYVLKTLFFTMENFDKSFYELLVILIKLPIKLPWKKLGYVYFCQRKKINEYE